MRTRARRGRPPRDAARWPAALGRAALLCGAWLWGAGCGEPGARGRTEAERAAAERAAEAERAARERGAAYSAPDTARPAALQVFERVVESESPRRLTLRLLVLEHTTEAGISKGLRLLFDSVAHADTALAAARAIVYGAIPSSAREAELVPVAWGYWIPPEGWEHLAPDARKRVHRSYIYFGVPPDPASLGATTAPAAPSAPRGRWRTNED
jgi:hypothetical protein